MPLTPRVGTRAVGSLGTLFCVALLVPIACNSLGGPGDPGPEQRYHPVGYLEAELHGMDAKLQVDACLYCHGSDLLGGSSERSCDPCHDDDWRTNCTFCHGGQESEDGAPPRDIRGETEQDLLSFPPHTAHVTTELREPLDCDSCHRTPEDVLSEGHFLLGDSSPGVAEVDLSEGLSSQAAYSSGEGCSNLYCHGDGQGHNGEADQDAEPMGCDSCHPSIESSNSDWGDMSGEHREHLREDVNCSDCHSRTTEDDESINQAALHVDGEVQLLLPSGIDRSGGRCDGECHDEDHHDEDWD